jgi:hypothetical protein
MWTFGGTLKSDGESDSILQTESRFRSGGIENQKLFIWIYTQIDGFIPKSMGYGQSLFRIPVSACILRETQLSNFLKILQLLYGYLKPIAFLIRVSNLMPVKWGF